MPFVWIMHYSSYMQDALKKLAKLVIAYVVVFTFLVIKI